MVQIQRYMVFFSPNYYPHGGIEDIIGQSEDLNAAIQICVSCFEDETYNPRGEFHIVDFKEFKQAGIDISYDEKADEEMFKNLNWTEIEIKQWI